MEAPGAQNVLTYPQLQSLLRIEFARARRYSYPLSCLVAQVDGIDRLRELHGSPFRDEVQRRVVRAMQALTRSSDSVGMFHERIAMVLPHTPLAGTRIVAERLRAVAAREAFQVGGPAGRTELNVTLSVGLSAYVDRATIFFDSVLKAAESALVQASANGGDRIEVAQVGEPPPSATGPGAKGPS